MLPASFDDFESTLLSPTDHPAILHYLFHKNLQVMSEALYLRTENDDHYG